MKKKSSSDSSSFSRLITWLKKMLILFKKRNRRLSKFFPFLLQSIQLTIVYFFAFMTLFYSVTSILGQIPEFFEIVMPPFMTELIKSPAVRAALAPERTYFIYLFTFEFVIFRSVFNFSKLLKYNLLLIFLLEMLQNLAIGYWDVIFNRQFGNEPYSVDVLFAILVITFIHILMFIAYLYSYCYAMQGKYTALPGMDWLTDSISFWLRIRTPRMGKK